MVLVLDSAHPHIVPFGRQSSEEHRQEDGLRHRELYQAGS